MNPGALSFMRAAALRMGDMASQQPPGGQIGPMQVQSPQWGSMLGNLMSMQGAPKPGNVGNNLPGLQGGLGNYASQLNAPTMLPGSMGLSSGMSY